MLHNMLTPQGGVIRAVLAIALAGNYVFAQATPPAPVLVDPIAPAAMEETELAPVTVSAADGVAIPVDETGVSVTVLDTQQLREEGVLTLTDALTRVPGAYVIPGGGLEGRGNTSKMVIRGMSEGQSTMPVMDGMRLFNSSEIGNISPNIVGNLNTFDIGTLEVLRGSQAAVYGGGNMGGVLYMNTPKGMDKPSFSIFTELGSFDSVTANVTAQGQVKKLSYFISSTYERTDNDLRTADGSPIAEGIGAYSSWQEAIRLDYQANETNSITLTYRRSDSNYESPYGDYDTQSNLITLAWRSQISSKYTTSILMGYHGSDLDLGDYYSEFDNIQLDWNNEFKWSDKHSSTAGISWNRNDGEVASNAMQNGIESVIGLHAAHTFAPVKNWENSVSLRLDSSTIFDEHFSFRAASSYKFNQERTRAFGSVSSGYLSPTAFERSNGTFANSWGQTYRGNPDLDVATSVSADFGIEQTIAHKHKVSATAFWSQIYDGVTYDYTRYAGETTFANSDKVWTMQGIELAMRGEFENKWNTGYSLSYTLTQPKTSDDKQVANTARQVWAADIHTNPTQKLTIGTGFSAAVGRTTYMIGDRTDNYFVLRAYARYQVNENIQLHLRAENITNDDYVTSPGGGWSPDILGPGIGIYGGVSIKF